MGQRERLDILGQGGLAKCTCYCGRREGKWTGYSGTWRINRQVIVGQRGGLVILVQRGSMSQWVRQDKWFVVVRQRE